MSISATAKKRIVQKNYTNVQIINLLNNLDQANKDSKAAVHVGEKVELIAASDIIYIEADGSYCKITTSGNQRYTIAKFLKDFEYHFGENSDFVRIHKSCMINSLHIKNYSKGEPCFIEMSDGITFEVVRRKKQEVLEGLRT